MIGVTDWATQKDKHILERAHSIYYVGSTIIYGTGQVGLGECRFEHISEQISNGMEVAMEVSRRNCTATFIFKEPPKGCKQRGRTKVHSVYSPILKESNRRFVPFFMMHIEGQSISYSIP